MASWRPLGLAHSRDFQRERRGRGFPGARRRLRAAWSRTAGRTRGRRSTAGTDLNEESTTNSRSELLSGKIMALYNRVTHHFIDFDVLIRHMSCQFCHIYSCRFGNISPVIKMMCDHPVIFQDEDHMFCTCRNKRSRRGRRRERSRERGRRRWAGTPPSGPSSCRPTARCDSCNRERDMMLIKVQRGRPQKARLQCTRPSLEAKSILQVAWSYTYSPNRVGKGYFKIIFSPKLPYIYIEGRGGIKSTFLIISSPNLNHKSCSLCHSTHLISCRFLD